VYIIAPVTNGVRDTDDHYFIDGVQPNETQCYCIMQDDAPVRETWTILTEAQYHAAVDPVLPWNVVTATVDKPSITANGTDTATVTATVPATTGLTTLDFIHPDAGALISTQPVANGVATLEVTATTAGPILIQAGDGAGPGNEVIINASAD
jgi:hypothetical protein